jgi:hypothetical protein
MRTINIINRSTVVTAADFFATVRALQLQISRDFAGAWNFDCFLSTLAEDLTRERIYVLDNSDQVGALGYHEEVGDVPVGYVFAKTDLQYGEAWSSTLSHEALEQLADPLINLCAEGVFDGAPADFAFEVCDPVENDEYVINGKKMSNFVLPNWFAEDATHSFDFLRKLTAPFTLDAGGYMSYKLSPGQWAQTFGQKAKTHQLTPAKYCRRARRMSKHARG